MSFKKILYMVMATLMASVFTLNTAFAEGEILRVSVLDANSRVALASADFEDFEGVDLVMDGKRVASVNVNKQAEVCGFEAPEKELYDASLIAVRRVLRVDVGEEFRVKVFLKNKGNMPWFKNGSSCLGPKMSLGTDRVRDHESELYREGAKGWESANRIAMDQMRVDPGKIASFTFTATAPDEADVYKQYLTPVLQDIAWIDKAGFSFEVMSGDTGESMRVLHQKIMYTPVSGSVLDMNLDGEKAIVVDRRHQRGYLILDNNVIREFQVSSGAPATPTPLGVTEVKLKQEVRVGSKPPHYIMPNFVWFRTGGYGFHSLPSLGKPGSGYFWEEALSHIGIPVSHGCVRLLPEDSDFLFNFVEVGTTVIITENVEIFDGKYDVSAYL